MISFFSAASRNAINYSGRVPKMQVKNLKKFGVGDLTIVSPAMILAHS
jgi:hypothetical protein